MATASKNQAKNYWKFPIFEPLYILKYITFNIKIFWLNIYESASEYR